MTLTMRIKTILWKIGILDNCPICNSRLIEVGYLKEDWWENYECSNTSCNFGKEIR